LACNTFGPQLKPLGRILTAEIDKQIYKLTATNTSAKGADAGTAAAVAVAPPAEALGAVLRQKN
jgi:hypothetical protein